MSEPIVSEIEQINAAQRELDLRKAEVMLDSISAVENAIASTAGKNFIKALRDASEGMVESTSRNVVLNLIGSLSSVSMAMQFEKSQFEKLAAPTADPAVS